MVWSCALICDWLHCCVAVNQRKVLLWAELSKRVSRHLFYLKIWTFFSIDCLNSIRIWLFIQKNSTFYLKFLNLFLTIWASFFIILTNSYQNVAFLSKILTQNLNFFPDKFAILINKFWLFSHALTRSQHFDWSPTDMGFLGADTNIWGQKKANIPHVWRYIDR